MRRARGDDDSVGILQRARPLAPWRRRGLIASCEGISALIGTADDVEIARPTRLQRLHGQRRHLARADDRDPPSRQIAQLARDQLRRRVAQRKAMAPNRRLAARAFASVERGREEAR
jgi:hypothetical protein